MTDDREVCLNCLKEMPRKEYEVHRCGTREEQATTYHSRLRLLKNAPRDLSKQLRELADDVDAGKVSAAVAFFKRTGGYESMVAASMEEAVVLSSLLWDTCVKKFKT